MSLLSVRLLRDNSIQRLHIFLLLIGRKLSSILLYFPFSNKAVFDKDFDPRLVIFTPAVKGNTNDQNGYYRR
jgi:hypothetical protein